MEFNDKYLISGSSDSTIIIWDLITGEKINQLFGHSEAVLDCKMYKNMIVSSSKDSLIKIWSLTTGKLLKTLTGHTSAVNAIHIHTDKIASAR